MSKITLHKFLKEECTLSFKIARKESVEWNPIKKIQERFDFVTKVLDSEVEYPSNSIPKTESQHLSWS